MTFSLTEEQPVPEWQARALGRSLAGARSRSIARLERFVGAARDLANETESAAFTVAQVAERAGLSLKSFYVCFAAKDDLLLALLEEDGGVGAAMLRRQVDAHDDPVDRVRAYFFGLFSLLTYPNALGYAGVLVREHRRLAEERPDDLRAALTPLVGVLADELDAATRAGVAEIPHPQRDAESVFGLLLTGVHEVTLKRSDPHDEAAHLWRLCWAGLRGPVDSEN